MVVYFLGGILHTTVERSASSESLKIKHTKSYEILSTDSQVTQKNNVLSMLPTIQMWQELKIFMLFVL